MRSEAALARFRDRVELRVAVVFRLLPRAFDPPFLLEPHERRIERPLIELQRMVGDLLEPRRQRIRVLRPHRRQRAQNDQIERALEELDAAVVFT